MFETEEFSPLNELALYLQWAEHSEIDEEGIDLMLDYLHNFMDEMNVEQFQFYLRLVKGIYVKPELTNWELAAA